MHSSMLPGAAQRPIRRVAQAWVRQSKMGRRNLLRSTPGKLYFVLPEGRCSFNFKRLPFILPALKSL